MDRAVIQVPTDAQRAALAAVGPLLPGDAYLAGGVAVATHLGHRTSHDLDFFVRDSDPLALEDDLLDLACMKLAAISKRGAARDFWDLHVILETSDGGLPRLLEAFGRKYPRVDIGHVVRSLAYFGDAETEPLPRGMTDKLWTAIRSDIESGVRAL